MKLLGRAFDLVGVVFFLALLFGAWEQPVIGLALLTGALLSWCLGVACAG